MWDEYGNYHYTLGERIFQILGTIVILSICGIIILWLI